MSFPEWGYSYNALCVPLTNDLQCSLVPSRDVPDIDRERNLCYEERQKARKEREEQIKQDRHDFDRLFRLSISRRAARTSSDFSMYVAFISEHLRISGLRGPTDGDSVTSILRDAVRDGRLVPAIHRAWRGSRRVTRRYAPQGWPKREPDPKPTVYGFHNGKYVPLDANGFLVDDTPYVPTRIAAKTAVSANMVVRSERDDGDNGADWLGSIEAIAGSVLSAMRSDDDSARDPMLNSMLSDSQPFEYQPGGILDQGENISGILLTPAEEAECELGYDLDMAECSAYAAMDRGYWSVCKERAMQRYSNCLKGRFVG